LTDRPVNEQEEAAAMDKVRTRAGDVAFLERGRGAPVVLLHATLHDHRDFAPLVEALAREHRVIAPDWPGHGRSPLPAAPAKLGGPLLADVLEDLVEALELAPAVLVGNSTGGYAAARLAVTHPERVAGLVLVNTGGFAPMNALARAYCRTLGTPAVARRVLPAFVPRYMRARSDNDREVAARVRARARTQEGAEVAAAMWRSFGERAYDLRPVADAIAAPTLIVWGAKDPTLPLRVVGRATQRAIAGARMETMDTGHVPFSSDPERFLAHVQPFLGRAFAAAPAAAA
jgi:pimeloyl-ACP methyl ester carboxylesterase